MATITGTPANPVYNPTPIPSWQDMFGGKQAYKNIKGDLSGGTAAGFNYWQQQQQNAYELDLWRLNNEYNTPAAQMKRFQDAGLNPNLIYNQQNTSAGMPSASAPIAAKPTNFKQQNAQTALNGIASLFNAGTNVLKQAREFYMMAKYGEDYADLQNNIARQNLRIATNQAEAAEWSLPYRNAAASAMGWYYGNGIPWNSPYMQDVQVNRGNRATQAGLYEENAKLARVNAALSQANIFKVNAETGRIEVDSRRLEALIRNINADTYNKVYIGRYMYPLDVQMKTYELENLMPLRAGNLMNQYNIGKWNYGILGSQAPWNHINTGYKWLDDTLKWGASAFGNMYTDLPFLHPGRTLQTLGSFGNMF